MSYFQYVGNIERAMLGTAGFIHELGVHVSCWRHDGDNALPLFIEKESSITYLGTWKQEVVYGTQSIHWQVINLLKKDTKHK